MPLSPRTYALGLAALLTVTGTLHLVKPSVFRPAVPRVPAALRSNARSVVIASGAAELACAAALAIPATRRAGGYASAALFIAVFPGNVQMALDARTPAQKAATIARLPLQLPLALWARAAAQAD